MDINENPFSVSIGDLLKEPVDVLLPPGSRLELLKGTDTWYLVFGEYYIDLNIAETSAQKWNWIRQMSGKAWIPERSLVGLVHFFCALEGDWKRTLLPKLPHTEVSE